MSLTIANAKWNAVFSAPDPDYSADAARAAFDCLPEMAALAGFTEEEQNQLAAEMSAVSADPELLRAWSVMVKTLMIPDKGPQLSCENPGFGDSVKNPFGFILLVCLGCVPYMINMYQEKGWFDALFAESLLDYRIWMQYCRENHNAFGLPLSDYAWNIAQMDGRVIRLGRLQCNTGAHFFSEFRVLKNRLDGRVCTMVNTAWKFTKDGLMAFKPEVAAFETAPVVETDNDYTGFVSNSVGIVGTEPVTLSKKDWAVAVKAGDPAINLHIPADGPLNIDGCRDSFRRMLDFYRTHLKVEPKAFICESWLLDPQFGNILPEKSNIVHFQRLGHLMPWPGESDVYRRVFGRKAVIDGIDSVPHKTGMQRAVADFLHRGGIPRNGAFVILPDEI